MKTKAISNYDIQTTQPAYTIDGCQKEADTSSPKFKLLALSSDALSKVAIDALSDAKVSVADRVFAIQNLVRSKDPEKAEDAVAKVALSNDARLSYTAYKTLALTGTAKTYEALAAAKTTSNVSLDRQKDFAALMIGYRLQLPGTEKILERLQKEVNPASRQNQEFKLNFQAVKADMAAAIIKQQPAENSYGVKLSAKNAFQVDAGGQTFYFVFSDKFDNPDNWMEVLKNKHVIGHLFRKEKHTTYVSQQYVALATPMRDTIQVSFFRRNGELFMLANIVYDKDKKSFVVSNVKDDQPKQAARAEFKLDAKNTIAMNLSYIRRFKKNHPGIIK